MALPNPPAAEKEDPEEIKNETIVEVWPVPVGERPIIRIDAGKHFVKAERVFTLACDSLKMFQKSRQFFGLFKGKKSLFSPLLLTGVNIFATSNSLFV